LAFKASFLPGLSGKVLISWEMPHLLPPPRFALTGYAWRSQAGIVGAKRVWRSSSEAKA
jgi:hypothetical protein